MSCHKTWEYWITYYRLRNGWQGGWSAVWTRNGDGLTRIPGDGQGSKQGGVQALGKWKCLQTWILSQAWHSPTALPPGNMVTALSFCFPICKLSKWCPLALVSAQEVVAGTQHLGLNKASFQAVEASHLSEQSWSHLHIFPSLNSVTLESVFIWQRQTHRTVSEWGTPGTTRSILPKAVLWFTDSTLWRAEKGEPQHLPQDPSSPFRGSTDE